MRTRFYLLIGLIVAAPITMYTMFWPGTAIVKGRVNGVAASNGGYLAQVDARQAFPDYGFFEVWSKCSLTYGMDVYIGVPINGMLLGHQPTSIEAGLYRQRESLGINGFTPWDGC